MSRKVIITSGLILVGQDSRSYIGLAWVITGMYGALFAWNHPIPDVFEDRVMTISIAVTVFNLGVGAVSKIPAENLPSSTESFSETVVFSVLILGANTLVIALLACKLILVKGVTYLSMLLHLPRKRNMKHLSGSLSKRRYGSNRNPPALNRRSKIIKFVSVVIAKIHWSG